eukprot:15474479-Alexandrium_andersonii.AAC.1
MAHGLLMLTTALALARFWLACAPLFRRPHSSSLPACFSDCAQVLLSGAEGGERVLVGLGTSAGRVVG